MNVIYEARGRTDIRPRVIRRGAKTHITPPHRPLPHFGIPRNHPHHGKLSVLPRNRSTEVHESAALGVSGAAVFNKRLDFCAQMGIGR